MKEKTPIPKEVAVRKRIPVDTLEANTKERQDSEVGFYCVLHRQIKNVVYIEPSTTSVKIAVNASITLLFIFHQALSLDTTD